jgi:hypothetical protein
MHLSRANELCRPQRRSRNRAAATAEPKSHPPPANVTRSLNLKLPDDLKLPPAVSEHEFRGARGFYPVFADTSEKPVDFSRGFYPVFADTSVDFPRW